ncbi:MAG: acylase [Candidatus Latescibacteria bacterium]|nr:acylase [Candidatus Latescibacterota bacterium]NIM21821.1 acylase [Candidatus Latescibacterota bacterium]NIM65959.1 acylase [Candidatus Latescibacterota bacterium]NIO02704.1 acylase [Candidatus Latescibacterota bacterium]NIO29685.1 acylase [Candidatus Latescibacterota bacterium]
MPFYSKCRKWSHGARWSLLMILSLLTITACLSDSCTRKTRYRAEILWDTWGVPHIFAENPKGLFYAFGWAQMESHGDLILRLYGLARGRSAEYWSDAYLDSDRYIWTMGIPERAREWYQAQSADFQEYLDAFTEGMNDYAEAYRDNISDDAEIVLPVGAEDVMAHLQRTVHLSFVGDQIMRNIRQWSSLGSNAWAIGPSRSASGTALLLSNVHLPWSDLYTFYEAQLTSPELNVYGVALVGLPLPVIAFNDHLGWTHTVNTLDGMDIYELSLSGEGYRFDGKVLDFDKKTVVLRAKQEAGGYKKENLTVHRSVHGPVLSRKGNKALSVRLVGFDKPFLIEQYWDMLRSTNLTEFESALKRMQLPFFNVIYADRDGHIMYLFGGLVPKRSGEDWTYWQGIVPGMDSTTLWTETHPYVDLPRVVDPASGWVQNTNDPPWTATFPTVLDPDNFPSYMSPRRMSLRSQHSIRMLMADESISFEELIEYKHSTHMELADRLLDDLILAARKHGNELAKKAADVLEAWDRKADVDSRGALLFAAWAPRVGSHPFANSWSASAPLETPNGLADPTEAVSALESTAEDVISDFEELDVPWGEIHRLRRAGKDYPAHGGPDWMGTFQVSFFTRDTDGRFRTTFGDSYTALVEFSDPIRARVLLSYGNASQPGSVHNGDQLELFSRKELRPVWRTREAIESHLEKRKVF